MASLDLYKADIDAFFRRNHVETVYNLTPAQLLDLCAVCQFPFYTSEAKLTVRLCNLFDWLHSYGPQHHPAVEQQQQLRSTLIQSAWRLQLQRQDPGGYPLPAASTSLEKQQHQEEEEDHDRDAKNIALENHRLHDANKALAEQLRDLAEEKLALAKESNKLSQEKEKQQKEQKEQQTFMNMVEGQKQALCTQVSALESQVALKNSQIQALESQLEDRQKQLDALHTQLALLRHDQSRVQMGQTAKAHSLETQLQDRDTQVDLARREVAQAKQDQELREHEWAMEKQAVMGKLEDVRRQLQNDMLDLDRRERALTVQENKAPQTSAQLATYKRYVQYLRQNRRFGGEVNAFRAALTDSLHATDLSQLFDMLSVAWQSAHRLGGIFEAAARLEAAMMLLGKATPSIPASPSSKFVVRDP